MIKKSLFLLYALIIALSGSLKCNAQLTDAQVKELLFKIDDSIASIKTVAYKIEYANKYLSKKDTVHTTAVCSLYIAPKDKMKAYSIVDGKFTEMNMTQYMHRAYDGKKTSWANCRANSLGHAIKPEIGTTGKVNRSVVENYSNVLLPEYLNQEKPFGRYAPAVGMIGFKEEMLHDVPVYVFTITFKDKEDVKDNVEKHYVRKSDLLPVAYSSFLRWEGMEQYRYYEVEYLAINTGLTAEDFKISKDEILNAKERYAVFMDKIKK